MLEEQQLAFWDAIDIFDKEGLLTYVMLIGSWAEYIYQYYFGFRFRANLKTRDVDFLYKNINRPKNDIMIKQKMETKGFIYRMDVITGVGKFVKEDLLELEFVTRVLGAGQSIYEIPCLGIKAEGLRAVNMLADYPLELYCNNYIITVPEPEAYVLQKLLANPTRKPEAKKDKDILAVRELVKYVDIKRIEEIFNNLARKNQNVISNVCKTHHIEIFP